MRVVETPFVVSNISEDFNSSCHPANLVKISLFEEANNIIVVK